MHFDLRNCLNNLINHLIVSFLRNPKVWPCDVLQMDDVFLHLSFLGLIVMKFEIKSSLYQRAIEEGHLGTIENFELRNMERLVLIWPVFLTFSLLHLVFERRDHDDQTHLLAPGHLPEGLDGCLHGALRADE